MDKNSNKNKKLNSFQEENKKKFNKLLNDEGFLENNNYLLRLLKKSKLLPDKYELMTREKNEINLNNEDIKYKKEMYDNNQGSIPYVKSNLQLTYELDDILYNHSKSFSKSKKRYYKIKKENDEFLAFYRFNNNKKSNDINISKRSNTLSSKKRYKNIPIEDNKSYDVFNNDNYLLMNNPTEIYYHFLYQPVNERKLLTQQNEYKYMTKMKRLLNNKSFEESIENSLMEHNNGDNANNHHYNEIKYNKTVTNFFNIKDRINYKKNKVKSKISLKNFIVDNTNKNKANNLKKNFKNNIIVNRIKSSIINNKEKMKGNINVDILNNSKSKNSKINNNIFIPIHTNSKNNKDINIRNNINKGIISHHIQKTNDIKENNNKENDEDKKSNFKDKDQNILANTENNINSNSKFKKTNNYNFTEKDLNISGKYIRFKNKNKTLTYINNDNENSKKFSVENDIIKNINSKSKLQIKSNTFQKNNFKEK